MHVHNKIVMVIYYLNLWGEIRNINWMVHLKVLHRYMYTLYASLKIKFALIWFVLACKWTGTMPLDNIPYFVIKNDQNLFGKKLDLIVSVKFMFAFGLFSLWAHVDGHPLFSNMSNVHNTVYVV